MIKKDNSLVALSLGIAITSQNMIFASAAEPNGDATVLSDDEIKIKINRDNNLEKETNSAKSQQDPKKNNSYSMGGDVALASMSRSQDTISINKNLSNPKAIGSGISTSNNLNVRSGPSSSNGAIGTLKLNEKIEILGTSNDWYKVDFNGKEGYVSSSYIKLNALEKGIDVSKWNGTIDWNSVKNSGIDYVIIRAGYGTSTVDPQFKSYIEGAKKAGLKIGVYWFSYATSVEKAKQEAQACLQTLSPYKSSINYPVFFDFEYASVDYAKKNGINITKNLVSQMANAFLNTVKSQGYTTGLYTNRNFSNTYYNTDLLNSNNLWIAQYNSTNSFGKPYSIWQYSESGKIPGISGAVDLNYTCLNTFGINLNTNSGSNSNINTGTSTPSASSEKGVTTANLNFRKSASTSSLVINTIPKNTTIEILEQLSSGWYKIKYKGLTGYVSGSYVSIKK